MVRALAKTLFLTLMIVGGAVAIFIYHGQSTVEHQLAVSEQKRAELEQLVARLESDRRVARIVVLDQKTVNAVMKTTLLFVEYDNDGKELPAHQFTINGNEAHFDAEVIKFKDEFVKANDPLRNHAIILFLRVYGADQAPADGFAIDMPGQIPEIYRGADPVVSKFEQDLWNNFWTLYNDKSKRDARGIRGLNGEGLWGRFEKGHVYTVTIRTDGSTINEEPIEPIYRQYLQQLQ